MRLTHRLTDSFFREGIISDEEKEIVRFGLESMTGNLLGVLLTMAVGVIFGHIEDALLLWLCLFPLRKNAGGYHALTRTRCLFLSAGMLMIAFVFFTAAEHTMAFYGIAAVICGCVIWALAPVGNPSKELDELEYSEYRKRSRMILAAEGTIYFPAMCFQWEVILRSIGMTLFIVSISLVMGVVKSSGRNLLKG